MPQKIDLSVAPYHDDFTQSKNFHRILFRPSYAVQARELNQLQTILQNQVEVYGEHIFKDGSPVLGGELVYDKNIKSLKLEPQHEGEDIVISNFNGKIINGSADPNPARAQVISVDSVTVTEPDTLIIVPLDGNSFSDGELISTEETTPALATTTSALGISGESNAEGVAAAVSINSGFYFINGFFVYVNPQTLILEKYTNTPSYRIGLQVNESLVTSDEDTTLLDNAQDSFNYAAPGAHRLKIELILTKRPLTGADDVQSNSNVNFIELLRVVNGVETKLVKYPIYSELEKTLARRTYDESGDYTVKPFGVQIIDHRPQDGSTANSSKFSVGMDPGKAYIKGFEFENISTQYLDIDKGRDTGTVNNYIISSGYGNRIITKNVEGFWNIKKNELIDLHCVTKDKLQASVDTWNSSAGPTSNSIIFYNSTKIGTARIRNLDWYFDSGSSNTSHFHSDYEAFLYDIRTTNKITGIVDTNPTPTTTEFSIYTASDNRNTDIEGAYIGSKITVNTTVSGVSTSDTRTILGYTGGSGSGSKVVTIDKPLSQSPTSSSTYTINYNIENLKSIIVSHSEVSQGSPVGGTGAPDVYLTSSMDVDEQSKFNNDPNGATFIGDTNRNSLVFELANPPVATITSDISFDTKVVFKGQTTVSGTGGNGYLNLSPPGGFGLFKNPVNGQLDATKAREYFTVIVRSSDPTVTSGGVPVSNGQILSFGADTNRTITYSGATEGSVAQIFCNTSADITVDVIATTEVSIPSNSRVKTLRVGNITTATGSTSLSDGQIVINTPNKTPLQKDRLFVSDVFRLVKVIDSLDPDVSVIGSVSNDLQAKIDSGEYADITDSYILDNGQKDNFYDHGSIILKTGVTQPRGRILVIIDYFESTSGNSVFTVDSYQTNITTPPITFNGGTEEFTYDTIPTFTSPATGKTYQLRDCLDFRPVRTNVDNDNGANTENNLIEEGPELEGTAYDIAFDTNQINYPDPDGTIELSYSNYLGRIDKAVLTRDREFKIIKGVSAVDPISPPDDEDSMTLYILKIPPYTFNLTDVETKYIDNKRFTMRDIGKLEKRIEQLEYYATLSMLERETTETPVTSTENIDSVFNPIGERFKNGILVDSFSGHSVGDVQLEEYSCSIDFDKKILRPTFQTQCYKFDMSDVGIYSLGIVKNGDLVTLPFTKSEFLKQPLTSDSLTINPFNITNYNGQLKTYPDSSIFYDQVVRPSVLVNLEGQYDNWAYSSAITNGFGTHWNDWTDLWTGKFVNTDPEVSVQKITDITTSRSTKAVGEASVRLGIKTNRTPESIFKSIGNKIVNMSIVPYMEPQTVYFSAKGVKPSSSIYLHFAEDNIMSQCKKVPHLLLESVSGEFIEGEIIENTTTGGQARVLYNVPSINGEGVMDIYYINGSTASDFGVSAEIEGKTSLATCVIGQISDGSEPSVSNAAPFISSNSGFLAGSFTISSGQFKTGERLLKLSDRADGDLTLETTVAEKIFYSQGTFQSRDKLLVSTRPYLLKRPNINEKNIVQSIVSDNPNIESLTKPLSQSFTIDPSQNPEGLFLHDIVLFFKNKPTAGYEITTPPITLQIRPIIDGFPSPSIVIPFSEVVLHTNSINVIDSLPVSSNTEHQTTFKFESPVYLAPGEYAIVLQTNSKDYELWYAINGKKHIGTTNNITKQPYFNQLYRLQKSGEWSGTTEECLMTIINRCNFNTGTQGYAYFENQNTSTSGVSTNTVFSSFKLLNSSLNFNSTELNYYYKYSNSSNALVGGQYEFSPEQNITLTDNAYLTQDSSGKFSVNAVFITTNSKISPVIDTSRIGLITIENIISNGELSSEDFVIINGGSGYTNSTVSGQITGGGKISNENAETPSTIEVFTNDSGEVSGVTVISSGTGYVTNPTVTISDSGGGSGAEIIVNGETSSDKGNLLSRYISRRVTLRDGFDAADLRVVINAYKPQGADILVYYKVINGSDSDSFDDKNYYIMEQVTNQGTFSLNENDFKEFEFKTFDDRISYTSDEIVYDSFKTFAIKICMISNDKKESKIPKIRDMRAIALAD